MATYDVFLRTFVSCKSHVCGGRTNLQIINELAQQQSEQEVNVQHTITLCKRKASRIRRHAEQLLAKYRREIYPQEYILTAVIPDCLSILDTEILSNSIVSMTSELLSEHYIILHRVVSILHTLENEETNIEFFDRLQAIRYSTQRLLCDVYQLLSAHGSLLPPREIQETVQLCPFSDRMDKFVRDYYLVTKIKDIATLLHRHYSNFQ